VGTGSGQAAWVLAGHFERVVAFDASEAQLAHARAHPRIESRVGDASTIGAADASTDLVTVAQASHWFDQEAFFSEVRRVLRPERLLSLWTYYLTRISPAIDALVWEFYKHHLDAYWEPDANSWKTATATCRCPSTSWCALSSTWAYF
jgi:ubiquinone/menaquinone biosynthesis C-methylase UbiE